jgi:hypothetical protein
MLLQPKFFINLSLFFEMFTANYLENLVFITQTGCGDALPIFLLLSLKQKILFLFIKLNA